MENLKSSLARIPLTCFKHDVYEPAEDSFLLADTLLAASKAWIRHDTWPSIALEVGSGSGYVICSLALILRKLNRRCILFATDINPSATSATRETFLSHGIGSDIEIITMDLASSLEPRLVGQVDLLIFNPPYVPTPDNEITRGGIAAAWAGGSRGRKVLDRFIPSATSLLSDKGHIYIISVPDNDPDELLDVMARHGFEGRLETQRSADEEKLLVLHFWRKPK